MSEAKRYLQRIQRRRVQIETLEGRIASLDELVHNPLKGVTYDRDVVQTSHTGSDKIEELADMQAHLVRLKSDFEEERDSIMREIWILPTLAHMQLLSLVYIDGLTLQEAASYMGKSHDHVRHLHGSALAEFQRVVLDPRKEETKA